MAYVIESDSCSMAHLFKRLARKKELEQELQSAKNTSLSRCLDVVDLTALGVGSTLGLGLYVLTGQIAATYSGPAVVLAWAIAGIASAFSGLCYAEFGARVPSAGSAYVYSYVTVGEFIAFVIGWNMILEYVIGTAGVASGYSEYINSLTDNAIKDGLLSVMPMHIPGLNTYPDFLSFGIVAVVTALLSFGVSESTKFNNVCTSLNLIVVAFVLICGAFKAKASNWSIKKSSIPHDVPKEGGNGGFAPFGFAGIMGGAAKCFFGFVGFDIVATTGEEVKNPKKAIPVAFCASLIVIFICYCSVATIQTLMQPYYLQDNGYALPFVFELSGYIVGKWIISIGALAGLSTSMIGAMFPLPRVVYAMAKDGVIFRWLGTVNKKTQTPVIATILSGILAGFMATMFNLNELIDMMSIGTLMAYTLVSASVLVLRYKYEQPELSSGVRFTPIQYLKQAVNMYRDETPTLLSDKLSSILVMLIGLFSIMAAIIPAIFISHLGNGEWWAILFVSVSFLLLILSVVSLWLQPQQPTELSFQVPFVPVIPCLGIFVNIYLMLSLNAQTWIRFGVWLIIGLIIYFAYGMFNSSEEYAQRGLQPPTDGPTPRQLENTVQVSTNSEKSEIKDL